MSDIIVLVMHMSGVRVFYEFSSYEEFDNEFHHLSNNTYLQGAVLKGRLWDDSKKWDDLNKKIKRMHW